MSLPPSLEVLWCAVECLLFSTDKIINYLLVAWAICIVCTAKLEILGAVNVFVTVTEKKIKLRSDTLNLVSLSLLQPLLKI